MMHFLFVLAVFIATSLASPQGSFVSVTQDTLGNYNFKYVVPGTARAESRDALGNVVGAFSYVDPHGIVRETQFTSGVHGYNAVGTDIPVPVHDTPEVAHAKSEHLAKLHAAYLTLPPEPQFIQF